jgi:DNA-binding response OmpR family regulator
MNARILVADDDAELRQLLRLILQRDSYDVIEAADGEQTLARALDSTPALILLDVIMPGVNGFDTCRRLKSDGRTHSVPVIFVSALNDTRSRTEGLNAGAEDYMAKPIDPRDLSQRVRSVIQRSRINLLFNGSASQKPLLDNG